MILRGYKAFNKDHTNRYGKPFVENKIYKTEGTLKFGNDGHGFHMAKNLSDVFRYFDAEHDNISVARVTGFGDFQEYNDEYYGYFDMYVFEYLRVDHFMSREEIIATMLKCHSPHLLLHFFQTYPLKEAEKVLFAREFRNDREVMPHLLFYQYGFKDAYDIKSIDQKRLGKVNHHGQNNS